MKVCFCIYLPETSVVFVAAAVVLLSTLVAYLLLFRRPLRKFEYRKLEKGEVRLIVIKKDDFSNPVIRCSIKHAELAQRPDYTALSYAWGDLATTKTIICSGAKVQVTENLYTALRRLRGGDQDYVVWVDALSISQDDVEERNQQVAMMSRIYSLATRSVVWLGEQENHEGERAFTFLQNLHSYLSGRSPSYASGGPIQPSPELLAGIRQMNLSVLKALFDRPWFQRLWVVQEVVKARESILVFGTQTLSWNLLERVMAAIASIGGLGILSPQIGDSSAHNIMSIVRTAYHQDSFQIRESSHFDLVTLFHELHLRECSDPRDKIYALLGLAWSEGLVPDYHLTAREVTHQFVDWCITKDFSLRFLFHAGIASHFPQQDLPSWFPQVEKNCCPRLVIGQAAQVNASKVFSSLAVRKNLLEGASVSGDILTLIGSRVDFVETLTKRQIREMEDGVRSHDVEVEYSIDVAKHSLESLKLAHDSSIRFSDKLDDERYNQFCNVLTIGQAKIAENGMATVHRVINQYKRYLTTRDPTDIYKGNASELGEDSNTRGFIGNVLYRRHFTVTSEQRFGVVPKLSRPGDSIVIFRGSTIPFVVRPNGSTHFTLVGPCYVAGIMMGEALDNPKFKWSRFKFH